MKLSAIGSILALVAIALYAQQAMPRMTSVEPDTGKAGDTITVNGEHLAKGEGHAHGVKGTISSVDADTVTVSVTDKKGAAKDHKVKTDSNTKITLDGKDAKLTDLKAGQTVTVTPGSGHGAPAAAIDATSAAK